MSDTEQKPHQAHLDKLYSETQAERVAIKVMGWIPNDLTTPFKEGEYIFTSSGIRRWTPDNSIKLFDPYNNNDDAFAVLKKAGIDHPLSLLSREYLDKVDEALANRVRDSICTFALKFNDKEQP